MTRPTPILVLKSDLPTDESNLAVLSGVLFYRDVKSFESYCLPLASGLEGSWSQPVYSMVTVSPLRGVSEPLPGLMTVFSTPMMSEDVVLIGYIEVLWLES